MIFLYRLLTIILLTLLPFRALGENTIKLGAIFSLTGFGALGGQEELNGLKLAVSEINASGGVNSQPIELLVEDCKSDLKATSLAFQKLANIDKVTAIIGPNWGEFTEIIAPLTDSLQTPTITASGWKKGLLAKHKNLFSLLPPHSIGAKPLAQAIITQGYKNIGLLVSQNAFFMAFTEELLLQLPKSSQINRIEVLPETTDFRTILLKLKQQKIDVLLVMLEEGNGLVNLIRQYKALNITTPLIGGGFRYQADQDKFTKLADGLMSLEYLSVGTPAFKSKYKIIYGIEAGASSARAYDAAFIFKKALEKCRNDRSNLVQCLEATDFGGTSGHIQFSTIHENSDTTPISSITLIKSGEYLTVDKNLKVIGSYN